MKGAEDDKTEEARNPVKNKVEEKVPNENDEKYEK